MIAKVMKVRYWADRIDCSTSGLWPKPAKTIRHRNRSDDSLAIEGRTAPAADRKPPLRNSLAARLRDSRTGFRSRATLERGLPSAPAPITEFRDSDGETQTGRRDRS